MRLLTVGSLPPEWGGPVRGGVATFHASLLEELARRDELEVVGVMPPAPLARELPLPVAPCPEGVSRAAFYEDLLERLDPDVVLMNHVAHTVGVTHARLTAPPPAVGVAHSWHNITFRAGQDRARHTTQEALTGLAAVVVPSRHCLREGLHLGLRYPLAAEVIHYPLQPLYLEAGLEVEARDRDGVLFLGSLIPRKNPALLVEAATLLPGLELTLAGEGELADHLRERIAQLRLGERVCLIRPFPESEHLRQVRGLLLGAQVMCLPSDSESFGIVFIEALACGTPIVGFGPTVREIRDELGIEIGEPLDGNGPEEIAAAIERVLSTDWDRGELRRATLAHFRLDRIGDRYVELLSRVAAPAGEGPAGHRAPASFSTRGAPAATLRPAGTAVCVLGPSRGGTSLTTRLLSLAGVYLGPPEELLGEDPSPLADEGEQVVAKARRSNPEGHWEHYRLMRLNERILRLLGGSWRDPPPLPAGWEKSGEVDALRDEARAILAESFAGRALWGWKDPRNSLTLPFWRDLLPDLRCVICLRHPLEVAESLRDRDGIQLESGIEHWTRYLAAALVNSAGRPRLLLPYEGYFRDPAATAARLARFAGCGAFDGPAGERMLAETIDEGLWRSRAGAKDALDAGRAFSEAGSLFRVAELLATVDGEGDGGMAGLGTAADAYAGGLLR